MNNCPNCNKSLSNAQPKTCKQCNLHFCCRTCLYNHSNTIHTKHEEGSPFIFGEYHKKAPSKDTEYSYSNFTYILDCQKKRETIGKGAYGSLYYAKQKTSNKLFAIKEMSRQQVINQGATLEIIKREISIHIRIDHPNIVKLYSSHEDESNIYMIMEYVPNGTLFNLIQKYRGLTELTAFKYFIQVVFAIAFLHKNGFAHRDIKPENILIADDDIVKLCDFGWCINISNDEERKTFCGTFEYMAPEIINGATYKFSTDIWSLGVLLYEMTHGYSPFIVKDKDKDPRDKLFENIKNRNYTINKKLSNNCMDLIDKLLTTNIQERLNIEDIFTHPWVIENQMEMINILNKLNPSASEKRILVSMSNKGPLQRVKPQLNNNYEYVNNNGDDGLVKVDADAEQVEHDEPFPPTMKTTKVPMHQKKYTNDNDDDYNIDIDKLIFGSNKNNDDDYDAILNKIQQRNKNSKKQKQNKDNKTKKIRSVSKVDKPDTKTNIADNLDISDQEEFAFLNELNQGRATSKKQIDRTKMIDMTFLPPSLLYNDNNIKKSTEKILKTIDKIDKAQQEREKREKKKKKKQKKNEQEKKGEQEPKGFWENFFSAFKCGECVSHN